MIRPATPGLEIYYLFHKEPVQCFILKYSTPPPPPRRLNGAWLSRNVVGSYPMNNIISVIIIISYNTIYYHISLLNYNFYDTIFKTSHYIRDGVLGVLAQYFNILLSCELTKKTSCTCGSNYF